MRPRLDLLIDLADFPLFVDDNRYAAAHAFWIVCRAKEQAQIPACVNEQWEIEIVFCGESLVRIRVLHAHSKHLCVMFSECARLVPERANLRRSATGEIFRIERQHDILLALKLTQLVHLAVFIVGDKLRRRLTRLNFARYTLLNQLHKVFAVCLHVHLSVDGADIPGLVDDERDAVRGIELFHDATVHFADREIGVGKQRESEFLRFLKPKV